VASVKGIDRIEVARMTPGMKHLRLPSSVYQRMRGGIIEVFKYLHGVYTTYRREIMVRHESVECESEETDRSLRKRNQDCHSCVM